MKVNIVRTGLDTYSAQCLVKVGRKNTVIATAPKSIWIIQDTDFRSLLFDLEETLCALGVPPLFDPMDIYKSMFQEFLENRGRIDRGIIPQVYRASEVTIGA